VTLLETKDLSVHFSVKRGLTRRSADVVHAADNVNLAVEEGQTLALVGESGSGKTTVAQAMLGLVKPTAGQVLYRDQDITGLRGKGRRRVAREMQVVFQDPYSSLNPRMTVRDIVAEPLRVHERWSSQRLNARVTELLEMVGLGTQHLWRRPHEFSGGQCQRIAIARALAVEPRIIILDEPTSALDVSVQARVLTLLADLQERLGLAFLFIAHDLAVVASMADNVAVMYLGRIVESGPAGEVLEHPLHPYTQALTNSVPQPDPEQRSSCAPLAGDVPSAIDPPGGCRFHPRCSRREDRCGEELPPYTVIDGRQVACHLVADVAAERRAGAEDLTQTPGHVTGVTT
jgi:oligopeptide transport system ATP-binding protein